MKKKTLRMLLAVLFVCAIMVTGFQKLGITNYIYSAAATTSAVKITNQPKSIAVENGKTAKVSLTAKGSGVKVAIQNCDWNNFVVSEKHWEVVLGALPELYIKYDASHAYNRGEDYRAVLSNWGERVAHVHIKGTTHAGRRGVDDPPAGMDDINWSSLFSILYARKYDGDLSIEPHSATWLGELGNKGVLFTRDFIRKYML
jgi:sugar phosphate isomerase/epimerase